MTSFSRALYRGFVSLMHPKMLALMLVPAAVALLAWLVAAIFFWGAAVNWMDALLQQWQSTAWLQWMLTWWPLTLLAAHLGALLLVLLAVPVVLVFATLVTGIFAMPMMVSHVARNDYPQLQQRHGGGFIGSAWNGLVALVVFVLLAVASLPLWLLPPLWPFISLGLLGYLNQRVFRYDALAEHADAGEMTLILREDGAKLFWLGTAVGVAAHVPVLGFFSPVYGGLVFVHYALGRLDALRHPAQPALPLDGTLIDNDGKGLL